MTNLRLVFFAAHLTIACLATGVQAATYTVTQGGCDGSGSLRDAIDMANANPGKDTVNFDASVTKVAPTSGSPACSQPTSIQITESVDILGPGSGKLSITDNVQWVTPSGHVNAGLACDSGNFVIADGNIPFVVTGDGTPEVTIKDLTFTKNFGVLEVRSKPAVINFEDVFIRENYGAGKDCEGAPVFVVGQLNMTNVLVLSNKMTNAAPRDAIVWVNGGARLEGTRFASNRAASQFFQIGNAADKIIIRESTFNAWQPRIVIAGGTADIVNTLIIGESGGAGVQGYNAGINLINSTIYLPTRVTAQQGPSGAPAGATHVWMEGSGSATLFNTIIHGNIGSSSTPLPMVAASGAMIRGGWDSHVTDGSGPVGPTSGDPNLSGNLVPLGPPTKNGGYNGFAIDPDTSFPNQGQLATDIEGNPRIQGPAVDMGVYEIQENHTYDDSYVVIKNQFFNSSPASVLDNDVTIDPSAVRQAQIISPPAKGSLIMNTADGTFTYQPATDDYGPRTFSYFMSATSTAGTTIANPATVTLDIQKPFPIDTQPDSYSINEGQTLVTTANNAPLVNDDLQAFIYMSSLKGAIVKVIDPPDHAVPGGFLFPPDGIFSYTPEPGFSGTDTFTYLIFFEKLGTAGSAETQVTIEVLDTNKPPVAQDDAYSTQQGVGLAISSPGPLANDSDPDGNTLSTVKKSDPAHGTVTFFNGGAFTYFPDPAFVGTDSFTYTASDGKAESNIATVTITLNPVNTPPIAQADKYRIPAESLLSVPARGGVLRNDTDPDGDSLSVSVTTDTAHGSLTLQPDGLFSYLPDAGFSGIDTFEYLLFDGQDSVSGIVTLIVTPTNQPPVNNADAYSVVQDTKLVVPAPSFLANDSDPEGHELYITDIQAPTHGQYTFDASGSFIYTPDPGFTGADLMGYTASDGELSSQPTAVLIQVTPAPVNEPPVAHNDAWSMPQDSFLDVAAPGILANDVDPEGHALTVVVLTTPATGTFTAVPGGGFNYRPPAGFSGQVSFTYKVNDGHSDSAPATGVITVSAVNNAPVANDDAYAMNAGLTLQVNAPGLTTNDNDPDGDALMVILTGAPAHGLLSNDGNGGFEYSPEFGFTGVDSFTYHVSDGKLDSNEATVQITVSGFNRAPVAIDDAWSTPQGTTLMVNAPGVLANDGDPEGHALTVTVTGQPTDGHLSPHPDGSFTYAPDPGFFGTDTFTYRVNDGLIDSNDATVEITVSEENLPPVANDDSYVTRQDKVLNVAAPGILGNDSDPEGHQLIAWLLTQPTKGHLVPVGGGGFTYDPDPGFFGEDSFTYLVSDGEKDSPPATVQITVDLRTRALFKVTKAFSDGSTDQVRVTLNCSTGLPLSQSATIDGGDQTGVTFVVTNILGPVNCEVTETGSPAGYMPVFNGGAGCLWNPVVADLNHCAIVNHAQVATFTAHVVWNVIHEGGNPVDTHNPVSIICDRDITSASSGNISNDMRTATAILGDGGFLTITVDTSGGSAACSAAQPIAESAVETESNCQVRVLEAGSSDSCTFVNTVFFEGIPMLGDRGLAILVLLMLGMGIVGVRRFA